MEFDGGARDRQRFQQQMLERFLTQPDLGCEEDSDYLLERMDTIAASARQSNPYAQSA
jgi:hypothetical protein